MKTDKELSDELDARDRLYARGYRQVTCDRCNGRKQIGPDICCWQCEGKGYVWEAPLTKSAEPIIVSPTRTGD